MKRVVSIILMLVMVMTFASCGSSCKKDDTKLTAEEAATLKLDDGDEAWIQEYLAGDTGLSKNGNVEGVDNKTSSSEDGTVISWDPIPGAVAYKVYRAETDGGKYTCIATVTDTSYTDTEAAGQKYYYKTTAVKKNAVKNTTTQKEEAGTTKSSDGNQSKSDETTKKGGDASTTGKGGSSSTTAKGDSTTKGGSSETTKAAETTTEKPTETTTAKPIPSAPTYNPSNSNARSARAAFEASARNAATTYDLAVACANSISNGSVKGVSNGNIISLSSKSIDGVEEAYQFTKDPSTNVLIPSRSIKMIGYVFKVTEDTDPAAFAEKLKNSSISKYYSPSDRVKLVPVFTVKEKTTDYYDRYVFFMVTE